MEASGQLHLPAEFVIPRMTGGDPEPGLHLPLVRSISLFSLDPVNVIPSSPPRNRLPKCFPSRNYIRVFCLTYPNYVPILLYCSFTLLTKQDDMKFLVMQYSEFSVYLFSYGSKFSSRSFVLSYLCSLLFSFTFGFIMML
jgi:hypothetical protein